APQRTLPVDAQEPVAARGLTEVAADVWLLVPEERLEQGQQVRDSLRLVSARRVFHRQHYRTPEILGSGGAQDFQASADPGEVAVEQRPEQTAGRFAHLPVRVLGEQL